MIITLLVAISENRGMGFQNQLPWHLPRDLKFFKDKTTGHHIIMGRKTYESIGKPLPNRINIVITSQPDYLKNNEYKANLIVVHSLNEALKYSESKNQKEVIVIGGGEIFRQVIKRANKVYLTVVKGSFPVDTFFPDMDENIWELKDAVPFPSDEKNKFDIEIRTYLKNVTQDPNQLTLPFWDEVEKETEIA